LQVKDEIEEIIDYLKNPALLRLRGVSRIGGVLLAGAPGTGKTLLAKAIAAESGVKMFTCSGTDFYDVYTGVGARRIRETFEMLRNFAPAVLFIDEFDALGAARGAAAAGDESASIINEMLVQVRFAEPSKCMSVSYLLRPSQAALQGPHLDPPCTCWWFCYAPCMPSVCTSP
jgi:cell division protease FtsH